MKNIGSWRNASWAPYGRCSCGLVDRPRAQPRLSTTRPLLGIFGASIRVKWSIINYFPQPFLSLALMLTSIGMLVYCCWCRGDSDPESPMPPPTCRSVAVQ